MHTNPPRDQVSDSRYIFILFWLIFVVLFFAFLIYFVYGQRQFSQQVPADDPTFEKSPIEAARNGETIPSQTNTATSSTTNTQKTTPTETTVATSLPTTVSVAPGASTDPSKYNPRTPDTLGLHGRDLLQKYFSYIQLSDYQTACSLLSNTICNARRDIYSFSQFLNKTTNGYEVKSISLAREQKPSEVIYCVEYEYSLKADLNPQPVTEIFQYRIKWRPDGGEEITARVCEKVIKDGKERPCPIITPKKYCS